ncbi:MAG: tetratricopeptide repeat protein [Gemmatimonadaceae bacterium]
MANTALIEDLLRQFSENPRRVFARLANELRKSGDYDRAIEICRAQIPHQPGYISGHIVLGQSLYDSGRLEEARQSFETALNLDPENLIALRHLGDIARQHGENDVAKGWYRRLLEVDPQNDEVTAQLDAMGQAATAEAPPEPPGFAEEFVPTIELEAAGITPASGGEPTAAAQESDVGASSSDAQSRPSDAVAEHEPLEIETADDFEPTAGAEKAFPELEQSLEVGGLTPEEGVSAAAAQSMFGDAVRDEARREREDGPRDADAAYSPMLDIPASAPAPAAFVTENMAELYLQQGYTQEALDIFRQLAAQNPADETLRERVRQLEQGSRSSIGMAAISDEVLEKAHKRATEKPKRTIRHFFAKLAMRRVVERESEPEPEADARRFDDQEPDEFVGARRVNEPPVMPPPRPTGGAPELDEPAWLRADPEPEPPPAPVEPKGSGPFALLDEVEWNAAVPRTPQRGIEPPEPPATPTEEVPWLTGHEPVAEAPSPPEPPSGGEPLPLILPPSELFPAEPIRAEDENAAATLASAFEPEFAARLTPVHPMPSQPSRPDDQRSRTPAASAPATREAEEDLSLDQVFGRTPVSGPAQRRSGFTFDQFFDEEKGAQQGGEGDASSEIELFNTWLDQLKK